MGVVYHAHYLAYFEQGRTEFLRALGTAYREVEEQGTLLVVVETGLRFLRPARYDDLLTVRTWLREVRGVRLRFEYEVVREDETLATGHTVLAHTDLDGRPCRPPAKLADMMNELYALGPAGHLAYVADTVRSVTGQTPRSFRQFAQDHATAFRD